jgi:hypothetical protein
MSDDSPTKHVRLLHEHNAQRVEVLGSWDGWRTPGPTLASGRYSNKHLVDGTRWQDDPANPHKAPDTFGRVNSLLIVPAIWSP